MVNRGREPASREVLLATERKGADAVDDSIRGRRKAMIAADWPWRKGRRSEMGSSPFQLGRRMKSAVIDRILYRRAFRPRGLR